MYESPYPYYGGKGRTAPVVWQRFGDAPAYIEPFAGSLGVLLGRPTPPRWEVVNDVDHMISNFWRATQEAPDEVARWCDWPVNEVDQRARHKWLISQPEFFEKMESDPHFYDAKVAGWWVWGISCWIGGEWCKRGVEQVSQRKPALLDVGVHAEVRRSDLQGLFQRLRQRMRRVKVYCGDWARCVTETCITLHKPTSIFLDPPYANTDVDRAMNCYVHESGDIAHAVREWAIENGKNPNLRIALCGFEGEHQMPADWSVHAWSAKGGIGKEHLLGGENRHKQRIWFSPHCLAENKGQPAASWGF